MHARHGSALVNVPIVTAIVIAVVLLSGVSYEQVQRAQDRDRSPQIGRSVDIGGRSLNLFCSGEGQPTVVFESSSPFPLYNPREMWEHGAPRPGYSWVLIQRETAQFTRACWYDRAGSGWSDLGPYPRTSTAQARDLHALLEAAHVPGPYVLAAEVSAALDAHVFTSLYPSEVTGLVFADGVHPDLLIRARPGGGRYARVPQFVGHSQDVMGQLFNQIGLVRFLDRRQPPPAPPAGITSGEWNLIWRLTNAPKARAALLQETASWAQSTAEARAAGTLGDRPLVVVSSEDTSVPHDTWVALQTDLSRLSTRGTRIQTTESGGDLIYQAPDAIVAAVHQVVGEVNATTAHSPDARPRP